jgi:hypothetical protein
MWKYDTVLYIIRLKQCFIDIVYASNVDATCLPGIELPSYYNDNDIVH